MAGLGETMKRGGAAQGLAGVMGERIRVAAGALLFVWAAMTAPQAALSQSPECGDRERRCLAECAAACAPGDAACRARCEAARCGAARALCGPDGALAAPDGAAAPASEARRSRAAPSAESGALAPRTQSVTAADAPGTLSPHILFLPLGVSEPPSALYYGYLIIGQGVSQERKNAVAQAIACRLKALPDVAAAAAVRRLGLVTLPATREAGATRVSPADVLEAYDFDRAGRWLRAAGFAAGETFDPDDALVFVASRRPRARQMDSVIMPGPSAAEDPVIADASQLSADFAGAWAGSLIDGMERGQVRSRQELQLVMEANSWLTWAASPVASLFKVTPAQAASAPPACP